MKNLIELIKYILHTYPKIEELSKPRLVKIIYLIDWKYTLDNEKQYTKIKWIYNHYGPYVNDVINVMKQNPNDFQMSSRENPYGGITDKFNLNKSSKINIEIDLKIKKTADLIISKTVNFSWSRLISVVYSTYPVKNNLKYSVLDLEQLAKEYKKIKTTANNA